MQKYFRTRENRNFSTVKSTEGRIFNFSVVESGLMVCMAGLQVFIVRFFFQGARKGMFYIPSPQHFLFGDGGGLVFGEGEGFTRERGGNMKVQ